MSFVNWELSTGEQYNVGFVAWKFEFPSVPNRNESIPILWCDKLIRVYWNLQNLIGIVNIFPWLHFPNGQENFSNNSFEILLVTFAILPEDDNEWIDESRKHSLPEKTEEGRRKEEELRQGCRDNFGLLLVVRFRPSLMNVNCGEPKMCIQMP